jgi:hypothetical protein
LGLLFKITSLYDLIKLVPSAEKIACSVASLHWEVNLFEHDCAPVSGNSFQPKSRSPFPFLCVPGLPVRSASQRFICHLRSDNHVWNITCGPFLSDIVRAANFLVDYLMQNVGDIYTKNVLDVYLKFK